MKFFMFCVVLIIFWTMFITLIGLLTIEAVKEPNDIKTDRLLFNDFTKHINDKD